MPTPFRGKGLVLGVGLGFFGYAPLGIRLELLAILLWHYGLGYEIALSSLTARRQGIPMDALSPPIPRRGKKPRWSLRTSFWVFVTILSVVTVTAFSLFPHSLWMDLEVLTAATLVLYRGVRFDRKERIAIAWRKSEWMNVEPWVDTGGVFTDAASEAGVLGCLVGILLDIAVSFLLSFAIAFLVWVGANLLFTTVFALSLPLFVIFRRSVRYVVAKGRFCHGNMRRSLLFALWATLIYTGWLYAILFAAYQLTRLK
jgi:hypothetical protein